MLKEDDAFWVRWSLCAALMKTRLPQTASLLSILGYAIVLSEKYDHLLNGFAVTGVAPTLKLMFMGGFITLLAMGMYWVWCPYPIRAFKDRRDYVDYVVRGLDPTEIDHAVRTLDEIPSDSTVQFADLRVERTDIDAAKSTGIPTPMLISDYYSFRDRRGMRTPMICFSMLLLGALLFLLPAAINILAALPTALEIFDDRGMPM